MCVKKKETPSILSFSMIPTFKKADIKLEYHTAKVHNNFNKKKDYATFFGKNPKKATYSLP